MRALPVVTPVALVLAWAAPAAAERPGRAAAQGPEAPDRPAAEAEAPKDSPLPIAMFMAGAGVGTAAVGGYLTFATDDLGSRRLGLPLLVGGGLGAAAGIALIALSSKEPARAGRSPGPAHALSFGPLAAGYRYTF